MAIIQNKASSVGDVILIETEVPIIGLIALTSFLDTTVGETQDKLFFKEFRFSTDGINFSVWKELTLFNSCNIKIFILCKTSSRRCIKNCFNYLLKINTIILKYLFITWIRNCTWSKCSYYFKFQIYLCLK